MPVFAYRGLSANGRAVAGVIDADSARTARGKLRDLGIFPTDLGEEAASERGSGWSLRSLMPVLQRRVPAPEKMTSGTGASEAFCGKVPNTSATAASGALRLRF